MTNKLISYSLLAHINNNKSGISNFSQIFLPFVKKSLSELNNRGIIKGESIIEIKNIIDELFLLDIPVPYLKKLLRIIEAETNDNELNFSIVNNPALRPSSKS